MSYDELLRLASAPQDLVPDAETALRAEMSRRGLKAADVDVARHRLEQHQKEIDRSSAQRLLNLNFQGFGSGRFSRWHQTFDPVTEVEVFTTTVFLIFLWLPVIPLGTYRAQRRKGLFQKTQVLEKLPLDWNQILWVWMWMMLGILALILLVRFAPTLLRRW